MDLNVIASLYLFLSGLFCIVIHPVFRLQVINKSGAKTGSHVFYLKQKSARRGILFMTSTETYITRSDETAINIKNRCLQLRLHFLNRTETLHHLTSSVLSLLLSSH